MKNLVKLGIIATLFVLISFVACQKEQTNSVAPTVAAHSFKLQNVEVVEGRLVFKTESDLNALLDEMFNNQNSLENFDKHFAGFTSQYEAYNRFSDEDLVKTNGDLTPFKDYVTEVRKTDGIHLDRVADEPLTARLVNSEGLIQIGETVSKLTRNVAYQFNVSNIASYNGNKGNLDKIPNVTIKAVKRSIQEISVSGLSERGAYHETSNAYQLKNGNFFRQIKAEYVCTEPSFSAWRTAYVKIRHEKRGIFGSWGNETTHKLELNGNVSLRKILPGTGGFTTPISFSVIRSQTSVSEINHNVETNDQAQKYDFVSPSNVLFSGARLDQGSFTNPVFATCTIAF